MASPTGDLGIGTGLEDNEQGHFHLCAQHHAVGYQIFDHTHLEQRLASPPQ
jgi:hypothetical protein